MSNSFSAVSKVSLVSLLVAGCNSFIGLSDLQVSTETVKPATKVECTSNIECTDKLTSNSDGGATVPAVCIGDTPHCVPLLSEDCTSITGDYADDNIIIIGSLFSTTGAQAATNLARQQSAALAVEQINELGGVPSETTSHPRKLVLLSCDESVDLGRAATHLVSDLHVPAIVGPNTSTDTLKVSSDYTVPGGTVVMTPTGVASSIASLDDDNLTYQMVPNDVQRSGLMIEQLNELEQQVRTETGRDKIRLGIVYRDDALGTGTRTALNDLEFNGKPLADSVNFQNNVLISPYDPKATDQSPLVDSYVQFAPDIVVLAGTAEAVTQVMVPLEAAWTAERRPVYVGIDSIKVPELLTAVTGNDDLRRRVRGTGITPSPESQPAFDAFKIDYGTRFPGSSTAISGMGPSYDAVFAVAFALAANREKPATGHNVVDGFSRLTGGAMEIAVGATKVLAAFQELDKGRNLSAIGTFTRLEWNEYGAVMGATLEMWCVGTSSSKPAYKSSGLTYSIKDKLSYGTYADCPTE